MGEVAAQVMEGEILNYFQLALCSLSLERAKPIVDSLFRQTPIALRHKNKDAPGGVSGLQVCIKRLASFLQKIDIAPPASLIADMEPALLWTNMGMDHL